MKGDGYSRCKDCVDGGSHFTGLAYHVPSPPVPRFQCGECYREFNNQNELNMHMQVHRPRDVACPICGERRYVNFCRYFVCLALNAAQNAHTAQTKVQNRCQCRTAR
jgi:DNA-directed RNA polymerase subunit RPC12/RpoP